jgi:hypothetical protein
MLRITFLVVAILLTACDSPTPPPAPPVDATGEPVAARPAPAAQGSDSGMTNLLLGAGVGYLLGSSTAPKQPAVVAPVVVNRTVVIERPVATPKPPAPAVAKVVPPIPPAPAPKPTYAPPQPYVMKQSTPTYSAPPKPYTPPALVQ